MARSWFPLAPQAGPLGLTAGPDPTGSFGPGGAGGFAPVGRPVGGMGGPDMYLMKQNGLGKLYLISSNLLSIQNFNILITSFIAEASVFFSNSFTLASRVATCNINSAV